MRNTDWSIQPGEAIGNGVVSEVSDPTGWIVEKAKSAETWMLSHVEPVPYSCRDVDEIPTFTEHHQNFSVQVKAEQSASFHEEANLVFGVGMFR